MTHTSPVLAWDGNVLLDVSEPLCRYDGRSPETQVINPWSSRRCDTPVRTVMYAYISLNPISSLVAVLVVGYLVLSYVRSVIDWRTRQRGRPLPPGPTPLPVIGNLLDMPETKKWLGFQDLFAKYGANFNPPYHLLALSDAQRREYRVLERPGKSHRRNRRCRSGPGAAGETLRKYV